MLGPGDLKIPIEILINSKAVKDFFKGAFDQAKQLGTILGGAAVGGILAGPAGAAVGALAGPAVAGMAGTNVASGIAALKFTFSTISKVLADFQSSLGPINVAFGSLPIVGDALSNIIGSLTNMAGMANPAVFQQWTLALQDAQATIGHAFVPVLEVMTAVVRQVGDALAVNLTPAVMQPIIDAFKEMGSALAALFSDQKALYAITTALGFAIQTATAALEVMVGVLKNPIILGLASLGATALGMPWVGVGLAGLGLASYFAQKPAGGINAGASSVGMAAQPAQFQSFQDYQRQLQISAYSMASGATPEMRTAEATEGILQLMQAREIRDTALEVRDRIERAAQPAE